MSSQHRENKIQKSNHKRINILGINISAVKLMQAVRIMEEWIEKSERQYVCVVPDYPIMLSIRNKNLRDVINDSGMATPDGMSSVWSLKLFGFKEAERVYGPDLMLTFSRIASRKGYRNYYYGGRPEVPELLSEKMKQRFPGLEVVGTYSPPFRPIRAEEDKEIVERINKADPDVVWVGLSTPKQDFWMADHIGKIKAPVMVGVGAAFDFLSGVKPQAPLWMQTNGLEWLFRLFHEPARLWKRNLLHIPCIMLVIMQKIGILKFHS